MIRIHHLTVSIALCWSITAWAITLYNHTEYDLYARAYYVDTAWNGTSTGPARATGPMVIIPAQGSTEISRPNFSLGYNRELIAKTEQTLLSEIFIKKEYKRCATVSIGWNNGSSFHFASKDNMITGYNELNWHIIQPILNTMEKLAQGGLSGLQQQYLQHPYSNERARVARRTELSSKEQQCINNRTAYVKQAVERLLGTPITENQVPRIAVCMSGGGMRAALCSYGLFQGLDDCGFLDTVTYAAALSGSTWFLSQYLQAGLPLKHYQAELMDALTEVHMFAPDAFAYNLWAKYLWGQHMNIVDLYGAYLAETFFRTIACDMDRQQFKLSDLQKRVQDGRWPFPLFTAVESTNELNWYTFTPYEVTCEKLGYAVPTWALGRMFMCEKSIDCAPELSLGFLMGLWGSALSGTLSQMLEIQKQSLNQLLYNALSDLLVHTGMDDMQWAAIHICNPIYCTKKQDLTTCKQLTFIDGGYAYNLPLPPVLNPERSVDLIIILDVSEDVHQKAGEMDKALAHIHAEGWPFPRIDTDTLSQKGISCWKNKNAPTVIYVIPQKDPAYGSFDPAEEFTSEYATSRFVYTTCAVEGMTKLMRHQIAKNKDVFKQAIQDIVDRKSA